MQFQEQHVPAARIDELSPSLKPTPILLDSPSTSQSRVSFDLKPQVKEIGFKNRKAVKDEPKYQIKNKTLLILKNGGYPKIAEIKEKARKAIAIVESKKQILVKYRRRIDIDTDLRSLGLKPKSYVENKIIVNGIGFRESEESIAGFFAKYGKVDKVVLEKNSKGFCTGKGTITFLHGFNTGQEFRLNGRLLRIERIKKQVINKVRLHISHMNKDINISKLRAAAKELGFVPESIKIDLINGKNKGYGFVEFKQPETAEKFIEEFHKMKQKIGFASYVEYSKEKS